MKRISRSIHYECHAEYQIGFVYLYFNFTSSLYCLKLQYSHAIGSTKWSMLIPKSHCARVFCKI